MNYTKGEWKVEVLQSDTHVESEHETICTNCSNENAQLISAAPNMFNELNASTLELELLAGHYILDPDVKRAILLRVKANKIALNKAQGNSQ